MEKKINKINLIQDRPLISILGEICWGFNVDNFEIEIGEKKEIVEKFLMRLVNEEKLGVIETYLSASELEIIKKALKVVEKELEEWEFSTRIGASLEEVKQILGKY